MLPGLGLGVQEFAEPTGTGLEPGLNSTVLGTMPGPWIRLPDDASSVRGKRFQKGDIVDVAMFDWDGHEQGSVVTCLLAESEKTTGGVLLTGSFVTASDAFMRWWFEKGAGKQLASKGTYHICLNGYDECPWQEEDDDGCVGHSDKYRIISLGDLQKGKLDWLDKEASALLDKWLKSQNRQRRKQVEEDDEDYGEDLDDEDDEHEEDDEPSDGDDEEETKMKSELKKLKAQLAKKKSAKSKK